MEDTGIGIPGGPAAALFERFHRVEGARGRTYEGTGIGLALVQELVRLHGGTVRAESVEDLGSTFTVEIPLGCAHLPPERIQAGRELPGRPSPGAYSEEAWRWLAGSDEPFAIGVLEMDAVESRPKPHPHGHERILLVDDNADMREYVGGLLREQYYVEVVSNGRAALERIRQQMPDLVLSDVMMPELDGFGLVRAIRGDSSLETLPGDPDLRARRRGGHRGGSRTRRRRLSGQAVHGR